MCRVRLLLKHCESVDTYVIWLSRGFCFRATVRASITGTKV